MLQSLHSEDIATKWATGPVIETPAFRKLVGATPCERIVGLIMIGKYSEEALARMKPRRYRRTWEDFSREVMYDADDESGN